MANRSLLITAWLVLALAFPGAGRTAPTDAFYEGVVASDGSPGARPAAVAAALREVVVRLTGRRAAANDPALAGLYATPQRFVQGDRVPVPGRLAVAFDGPALEAALRLAGQALWPRERTPTLVLLVRERGSASAGVSGTADPDLRRDLELAAQARGMPLAWAGTLDAPTLKATVADALAGRLEALRALAQRAGADGVLVGRIATGAVSWSWLGPAGTGTFSGPAGEAAQLLADRYGAQFAVAPPPPPPARLAAGSFRVTVRGVHDLAAYAAVLQSLAALPTVRSVDVEGVAPSTLRLVVAGEADLEGLRQAVVAAPGRLVADADAVADGALHLAYQP